MLTLKELRSQAITQRAKISKSLHKLTASIEMVRKQGDKLSCEYIREIYDVAKDVHAYADSLHTEICVKFLPGEETDEEYQRRLCDKLDNVYELASGLEKEVDLIYNAACQMHFEYSR
jgi:hypothetical protein